MTELVGTALLIPGQAFTQVIARWLAPGGPGLHAALVDLGKKDIDSFVDGELNASPPAPYLLRNATRAVDIGGVRVEAGEYVCALTSAAGGDPKRPAGAYLHFGPDDGPHRCFGRHIAHAMLGAMFLGLKELPLLWSPRPW
jgi:hypothetical protein